MDLSIWIRGVVVFVVVIFIFGKSENESMMMNNSGTVKALIHEMMRHSFEYLTTYIRITHMERRQQREEKNGLLIKILFLKVIADTEKEERKKNISFGLFIHIRIFKNQTLSHTDTHTARK